MMLDPFRGRITIPGLAQEQQEIPNAHGQDFVEGKEKQN
jgi:hypothetical protein